MKQDRMINELQIWHKEIIWGSMIISIGAAVLFAIVRKFTFPKYDWIMPLIFGLVVLVITLISFITMYRMGKK